MENAREEIAGTIKAQVDAAVGSFLTQDTQKIHAMLDAAISYATSPQVVFDMTEKFLLENLVGDRAVIGKVVSESSNNGYSKGEIASHLIPVLTGKDGNSKEAVGWLIRASTGAAAPIQVQKRFLVGLQTAAVERSGISLMDIVRNEQQPSVTSEQHVKKEIARMISGATGATYEASYTVASAAYSTTPRLALDLIYSSRRSPLRTLLATAQQGNPAIAGDIATTVRNAARLNHQRGAPITPPNRSDNFLVDLDESLKDVTSYARQNSGKTIITKARAAAGYAGREAKKKAEAVAGQFPGK